MTRNLKALGLALAAAFAFSALAASAAQAEFTFTGYNTAGVHVHTVLTTEPTVETSDNFAITAGKSQWKCDTLTGKATSADGEDPTVTLTPTYAGCRASIGFLTVEMTTCDYKFHITGKETEHKYTGNVDVSCSTPGDAIHITVFTTSAHTTKICDFTIDEQNGINGITYTNITTGTHKKVELDIASTNIHITTIQGGNILCQTPTGTTHKAGIFNGEDIVKCENAANEELNCTVSG